MEKDQAFRGKCRHCGRPLVYWHADEQWERYGMMVNRTDKPRWYHLDPDPESPNKELALFTDSKWGLLGAYCPQKATEGEVRGQPGEPVEYCVVLKGEWPRIECMNPVQDTDLFMCGIHGKKERERRAAQEAARARRDGDDAHSDGVQNLINRLLENWGLHAEMASWYSRGKVQLDAAELEALLDSFEEEHKSLQAKKAEAEKPKPAKKARKASATN